MAASRFPDATDVESSSEEIGGKALTQVATCPSVGEHGLQFHKLVSHIISISDGENFKVFCENVCKELVKGFASAPKFLLPSALLCTLVKEQDRLSSDFDLCRSILEQLQLQEFENGDFCVQFMLEFSLCFVIEILKYISETFRENLPRRYIKKIGTPDKDERQVIYFIAGSVIRRFFNRSYQYCKNATWQDVKTALKTKVLVDKAEGDTNPDFEEDSEWTKDIDRGGLLYINSASQSLFVRLATVIYENEKSNGSIDYDRVIQAVLKSGIQLDWDEIISDSLSEQVSLNVLQDVVVYMCQTCGGGFAKRRLNFIRSKPVTNLPTRHLAASRKNR